MSASGNQLQAVVEDKHAAQERNIRTPLISNPSALKTGFGYAVDVDDSSVPAKIGSVMSHSPLITPNPTTLHTFINA